MLRNLGVTAVVSAIMGLTTLALRTAAPPANEPAMGGGTSSAQADPMTGQALESPPGSNQTAGGMTAGGQTPENMMCPCMQMMMSMMQGGTTGGMMGGAGDQSDAAAQPFSNPRTEDQARQRAERYLQGLNNPNLQLGEINETAASYEVQIVTKDGSLVNWIIIEKQTGQLKTQY